MVKDVDMAEKAISARKPSRQSSKPRRIQVEQLLGSRMAYYKNDGEMCLFLQLAQRMTFDSKSTQALEVTDTAVKKTIRDPKLANSQRAGKKTFDHCLWKCLLDPLPDV